MPARKRGNNEGSIFYREGRKKKWCAQVTLDGHRLSYMGTTRQECQDWLDRTKNEINVGLTYDASKKRIDEFLQNWLVSMESKLTIRTFEKYSIAIRYLVKAFGKLTLKDLRPEHIQDFYNLWAKTGKNMHMLVYTHSVLHGALKHACKTRIIMYNPADAVIVPKPEHHEMQILDESEANRFLLVVRGTRYESLYQIALTTGMRQSEILGLKWSDVDWKNKTISVVRQLNRLSDYTDENKYFSDVKTIAGRRKIKLGNQTIEKLRAHLNEQLEERQHPVHGKWDDNDLVFPSNVGTPMNQSNLYRNFKEFLAKAGLAKVKKEDKNIRFHDLRHTAASIMLNHGTPAIVVSKRLGHSKVSVTLDIYGHLIQEMQDGAAAMIDELITPVEITDIPLDIGCNQNEIFVSTPAPFATKLK